MLADGFGGQAGVVKVLVSLSHFAVGANCWSPFGLFLDWTFISFVHFFENFFGDCGVGAFGHSIARLLPFGRHCVCNFGRGLTLEPLIGSTLIIGGLVKVAKERKKKDIQNVNQWSPTRIVTCIESKRLPIVVSRQ